MARLFMRRLAVAVVHGSVVRAPVVERPRHWRESSLFQAIGLVLLENTQQMSQQWLDEPDRQQSHPVLPAFPGSQRDRAQVEIDVFNPQLNTFINSNIGAIDQGGHQPNGAHHLSEDLSHLLRAQDRGEILFTLCPFEVVQPPRIHLEDVLVHEHEGIQRLRLGTGGKPPVSHQVVQESLRMCLAEIPWVTLLVEKDELPAPVDVAGRRAGAVVPSQAGEPDLLKQLGLVRCGSCFETPLA